jgi:hypothetical protein
MKGFVEEAVWAVTLVIAVVIISFFLIFQQGLRGTEVRQTVEERILNEEGNSALFTLFNNQLPLVEKTYLETAIDAILQGEFMQEDKNKVFYGNAIGSVYVNEIIPPLLDNYISGRWKLEVTTPDGYYIYGKPNLGKIIYTYTTSIPVPEERVGELILSIG